jgi:hypothetical protein
MLRVGGGGGWISEILSVTFCPPSLISGEHSVEIASKIGPKTNKKKKKKKNKKE